MWSELSSQTIFPGPSSLLTLVFIYLSIFFLYFFCTLVMGCQLQWSVPFEFIAAAAAAAAVEASKLHKIWPSYKSILLFTEYASCGLTKAGTLEGLADEEATKMLFNVCIS